MNVELFTFEYLPFLNSYLLGSVIGTGFAKGNRNHG